MAEHKKALSEAASFFVWSPSSLGLKGASSPLFATATTAASGGYREELLGQRPAGCECRSRHKVDAGHRNPSGPARRNRCDLAALNTRHLLRKPVCGLKAPLGLSCPPGTAVLSGSLLSVKREHLRPAKHHPKCTLIANQKCRLFAFQREKPAFLFFARKLCKKP